MTPIASLTDDQFWDFACAQYECGNTQELTLALQDNYGVNVNLLLFLCWCQRNHVVVMLSQFRVIAEAIEQSEQKLIAHRIKRKEQHPDMGGDPNWYNTLKAQELELERQQQSIIITSVKALDLHCLPFAPNQGQTDVVNASIASFVNLYQLREQKHARSLIAQVLCQ